MANIATIRPLARSCFRRSITPVTAEPSSTPATKVESIDMNKHMHGKSAFSNFGSTLMVALCGVLFVALPAHAGCWSMLKSPKWAEVQTSLGEAKLCEVLPAGPNRTESVTVDKMEVCDSPGGVRFEAAASVRCKSSPKALLKTSASASLKADVTVDIGTCTVTSSKLDLSGSLGQGLAARPEFQELVRQVAQRELSKLCGK